MLSLANHSLKIHTDDILSNNVIEQWKYAAIGFQVHSSHKHKKMVTM